MQPYLTKILTFVICGFFIGIAEFIKRGVDKGSDGKPTDSYNNVFWLSISGTLSSLAATVIVLSLLPKGFLRNVFTGSPSASCPPCPSCPSGQTNITAAAAAAASTLPQTCPVILS